MQTGNKRKAVAGLENVKANKKSNPPPLSLAPLLIPLPVDLTAVIAPPPGGFPHPMLLDIHIVLIAKVLADETLVAERTPSGVVRLPNGRSAIARRLLYDYLSQQHGRRKLNGEKSFFKYFDLGVDVSEIAFKLKGKETPLLSKPNDAQHMLVTKQQHALLK
jgi:hypothetical protein